MKKLCTILLSILATAGAVAEEPDGYYTSCEGKTGEALLKALSSVVSSHKNVGYDGLWEVYKTSDVYPDGTLWDIYTTKKWSRSFTKCGNYKLIGDCVNREHSFPKSWWGGGKQTQYSDAFHLYPTDGKVNGQRSSYPYGECAGGTRLPNNGQVQALGKLGSSTFPGFSGRVFEPDDMYKGDLARSYFYLAAAYNKSIGSWTQGNGKDMMAGNSYPVFKQWAIELLLKWSRQDPVSDKETDRNDAIYRHQNNRNPFIDHPELVEYIWGDKKGQAWYADAALNPVIFSPVPSSEIDLGIAATGHSRSVKLNVQGTALKSDVRASVSGTGFALSATSLSASAVNGAGAPLTVSYTSATPATASGTLTLSSDDVTATYTLRASAVDGLPVAPATDITESSFVIHWTCIDNATDQYIVTVSSAGEALDEYPMSVNAGDESLLVESLEPETTYTYFIKSPTLTSATQTVTTLAPVPSIQLLYDGTLEFATIPGAASDIAEILLDADNIASDITVKVDAPFQVSTDKSTWDTTVTLTPDEDRFYMRLLSSAEGSYTTSITLIAGDYTNDDVDVTGTVSSGVVDFVEDFESITPKVQTNYDDKTVVTDHCTWQTNAAFNSGDKNYAHSGELAARTAKSGDRYLYMAQSKENGIGTLSFWSRLWSSETPTCSFDILVSTDNGATWTPVGTVDVEHNEGNEYREFTLPVNSKGASRIKLSQTAGGRCMIDDISLTPYTGQSSIADANEAEYHSWDAYCRDGALVLESDGRTADHATVYAVDGTLCHTGLIPAGSSQSLRLAPGLYLVTVRDFTRRVVVK